MSYDARGEALRQDLRMDVEALPLTPHSIVVVRPKDGMEVTRTYAECVAEQVRAMVPRQIPVLVLSQGDLEFRAECPDPVPNWVDDPEAYRRGWKDAVDRLASGPEQSREITLA